MGRPRLHAGDVTIVVRLDKRLLDLIDVRARSEGLPRNTVITRELARSVETAPTVSDIKNPSATGGGDPA